MRRIYNLFLFLSVFSLCFYFYGCVSSKYHYDYHSNTCEIERPDVGYDEDTSDNTYVIENGIGDGSAQAAAFNVKEDRDAGKYSEEALIQTIGAEEKKNIRRFSNNRIDGSETEYFGVGEDEGGYELKDTNQQSDHSESNVHNQYIIKPQNAYKRILPQISSNLELAIEKGKSPERQHIDNQDAYKRGDTFVNKVANVESIDTIEDIQGRLDEALRLCQQAQQEWEEGDPDASIESLDSAYALLINVDSSGDAGIFQQKEDIRFLISKRIVEIYASRQRVVNGKHKEIPLVMNAYVEREIKIFVGEDRRYFLDAYKRSGIYRPMILKELREAGLPESLSWLPLIESGFKTIALSHARALGLWQFIPSTGYKFGLERNRWIDERMDPLKSTKAAIEYLIQLHHIFGDWTTVLAAYNCGEGTVLRAIRNQHINYLDNFWDIYERLPLETARYVPRFIAVLSILENPENYGLTLPETYYPVEYTEITINRQIRLSDLASRIGIGLKELTDLNPELRQKVTPDREYTLKVPAAKSDLVLTKLASIPQWNPPAPAFRYHKIKRGETLSHVAKKYGTTVKKIARINNIRRADRVWVGQKLKIPIKGSTGTVLAGNDVLETYTVKKGDCSFEIAKMFNMKLNDFLLINAFTKESVIYPGQKVYVRNRN